MRNHGRYKGGEGGEVGEVGEVSVRSVTIPGAESRGIARAGLERISRMPAQHN